MKNLLKVVSLVVPLGMLAACDDVCEYGGKTYQEGDSFPDKDNCNTCRCTTSGEVACTLMDCGDETCTYNDVTYAAGESFDAVDGCNTCTCKLSGAVECTAMSCIEGCEYGGARYEEGESFDALDGCNTCSCAAGGRVACTEMACPVAPCDAGLDWYEPGCGIEAGMPTIEAGCYAECAGIPCGSGVCQQTDINPCICDGGLDCCDACGAHTWLCLDPPESCASVATGPVILSAGKTFGECMGNCRFNVTLDASSNVGCITASLTVCEQPETVCAAPNTGTLTPAGQAKAAGLAAELMGVTLDEVYGCPDCADGGASQASFRFGEKVVEVSYEYGNPPELLARVDRFTKGLLDALITCDGNEDVRISDSDCQPQSN